MGKNTLSNADFDKKYEMLLSNLQLMPRETKKAQKIYRYAWFQQQPECEMFYSDIMELISITKIDRYRYWKEGDINRDRYLAEGDKQWKKKILLDPLAVAEAIKASIEEYTGMDSEGKKISIAATVNVKYRQCEGRLLTDENLPDSGLTQTRRNRMNRFMQLAKKIWNQNPGLEIEEVIEMTEEGSVSLSDKDREFVRFYLALGGDISLDAVDTEDKYGLYDRIAAIEKGYDQIEASTEGEATKFLDNLEIIWTSVKAGVGKKRRELIKAFLTKDILIQLKLSDIQEISQEDRKRSGITPESKCKQWCPRKDSCLWRDQQEVPGCYTRYKSAEAGDHDIYVFLKPYEKKVCWEILHRAYTQTAIKNNPETLYYVYANPLNEEFLFLDSVIASVLGKDKAYISSERRKYNDVIRLEMERCLEEL